MTDYFTGTATSSVAGAVSSSTTAYQALSYFALRQQLIADPFASVRATNQTHNGAAVTFFLYDDLSAATSALTETTDPDGVAMADSTVTCTLAEYGNAVRLTSKLRGTALLPVLADAMNLVGYNAGLSVDTLAMNTLRSGTNVYYSAASGSAATSEATIEAGDVINAAYIRNQVAKLRGANSMPQDGTNYAGIVHPYISADIRSEASGGNWRDPHTYRDTTEIYNGEIGTFEGVRWIENSSAQLVGSAAGSASIDVYRTLIIGEQALAKGVSLADGYGEQPSVFEGPIVDKLRRFVPVAWYHLVGYKRFRETSIRRIVSSTSVA